MSSFQVCGGQVTGQPARTVERGVTGAVIVRSGAVAPHRGARVPSSRALGYDGARSEPAMTRLTRLYIKTSLAFLVAGLVVGGYIIVTEFWLGAFPSRLLVTAHVH